MKATIFIRGIGMIHDKDDVWRVLFPFDDCHTVKFSTSDDNPAAGAISLAKSGREVKVRAVTPTSVFQAGKFFDDFLDITSAVAHKDGVKMKAAENLPSVMLTIENAELSVASHTFCRFQLLSGLEILTPPKAIAYSAKAVIEAESIVIEADGVDGFPKTFDHDVKILFDNICPPNEVIASNLPLESDLKLLYNVIEDITEPKKQLVIDRDPAQKPGAVITDLTNFSGIDNLDNILPGQAGLPCNVVKATKVG